MPTTRSRGRPAIAGLALLLATEAGAATLLVADWPADLGDPWRHREFEGETRYRPGDTQRPAVFAHADDSASCLYREIEIDLERTPFLQWSWRVEQLPATGAPETEKAGDDYGARVYVVREGLFGRWSARALNYVWSQRQPEGSRWRNAYTGRAVMWSVERGAAALGTWRSYTRDVRADWETAFGETIDDIDGVVIMTDADDSDSEAAAHYGSIRFCSTRDCEGDAERAARTVKLYR